MPAWLKFFLSRPTDMECIGNSDALYHNIEHQCLLRCRARHPDGTTDVAAYHPGDYVNSFRRAYHDSDSFAEFCKGDATIYVQISLLGSSAEVADPPRTLSCGPLKVVRLRALDAPKVELAECGQSIYGFPYESSSNDDDLIERGRFVCCPAILSSTS